MADSTEPFVTTEVPVVEATRILIVEKERIIRELLEALLQDIGRRVDSAANYNEAMALARESPAVDVALVEKRLPDGDGLELIQQLKSLDANVEVLLMSASPSLEAVLEAIEAGASDFIPKPFDDINQVAVRINAAAERTRLRRNGKWLHAELVESEERYRKLFEATPDSVLLIDLAAEKITDANPAALELYGYPRDQLVGMQVEQLRACEEHSVDSQPPLPDSQLRGVISRRDRRKDGAMLDVELVTGHFQSHGRDVAVEIIREISERLRAQAAQRELESKLLQSQKMEALGQLAGGIAHDFNNLLAVILNYTHFVLQGVSTNTEHSTDSRDSTDSLKADVEQILKAATSAASLTRQLLAFSRQEIVKPDVLDVNDVIRTLESLLQRTLGPEIRLHTALGAGTRCVRIDRGQLESTIVNLVINARDAMTHGGNLTIRTRHGSPGASSKRLPPSLEIEVIDSGQGIDSTIIDQIFDPFFTTKDRDKGTGLGLAMVKGVIEHAGGSIEVKTEIGRGSSFTIRLPTTMATPRSRATRKRPRSAPGPDETILIVDDDHAVRRAMVRIVKSAGYTVVSASGSLEALATHAQMDQKPSLILTDVLMADLKGDELLRRLRLAQPELKVVFVTGLAASALVDTGDPEAQRAVLPKPFTQEHLLEVVRDVLDDHCSGNQL